MKDYSMVQGSRIISWYSNEGLFHGSGIKDNLMVQQ
jgi:hypothetical protein